LGLQIWKTKRSWSGKDWGQGRCWWWILVRASCCVGMSCWSRLQRAKTKIKTKTHHGDTEARRKTWDQRQRAQRNTQRILGIDLVGVCGTLRLRGMVEF